MTVHGALGLITQEKVQHAASLVKRGQVIPLNSRIDTPKAPFGRAPAVRTARMHNEVRPAGHGRFVVFNDDVITMALQGASHLDALAHFGLIEPGSDGVFYGGAGLDEVRPEPSAKSLGVGAFGGAIVTRGVLLDAVAVLGSDSGYLPDDAVVNIGVVQECLKRQNVELSPGDGVLLFTGHERRCEGLDGGSPTVSPGVDGTTLELWAENRVALLASDNAAVERYPIVDHCMHIGALRGLGIPLGEFWSLRALAAACSADRDYVFMLVSVPLNIPGAFGSPANAVAIR